MAVLRLKCTFSKLNPVHYYAILLTSGKKVLEKEPD